MTLKNTDNALKHTYNKGRFISTLEYVMEASALSPFEFMTDLGAAAPNHGTQLEKYMTQIYDFCAGLPGVDISKLQDSMVCDWLGMVKGKNTPAFLKNQDSRREHVKTAAEKRLGVKLGRHEYAVLNSGKGVFVDSSNRDPVTGLYKIHII